MSPSNKGRTDSEHIIGLVHRYCTAVDQNDPDAIAELFTDDAELHFTAEARGTVTGVDAIQRRMTAILSGFTATSHHVSNIEIDVHSADEASGVSYLFAWHRFRDERPDGYLYGRYHDRFRRESAGWKIAERTLRITGEVDFPMPWNPPDPPRAG